MTLEPDNTSSTDTPPAVYVDKLSFRYRSPDDDPEPGRKTTTPGPEPPDQPLAIEDISFSLPAGELMLIAGPSGCGKSTLLKCLNGLIPNSYHGILSGEIQLEQNTPDIMNDDDTAVGADLSRLYLSPGQDSADLSACGNPHHIPSLICETVLSSKRPVNDPRIIL